MIRRRWLSSLKSNDGEGPLKKPSLMCNSNSSRRLKISQPKIKKKEGGGGKKEEGGGEKED